MPNEVAPRVLFICPQFFGYHQRIVAEFEKQGATVDWFDDRANNAGWAKALLRVQPQLMRMQSDKYFQKILDQTQHKRYDLVFFIKAESISVENLARLKQQQLAARFVYYTWDSLANVKNAIQVLNLFHTAYSFDKRDCAQYQCLQHLPLFYSIEVANPQHKFDHDVVFIASFHSDRLTVWGKIRRGLASENMTVFSYIYFQSVYIFYLGKLFFKNFRAASPKEIQWTPMKNSEAQKRMQGGRILIDIHNEKQTGLTMRMIESLGLQKKIITTNEAVRDYDFYHPHNVLVVNRKNPVITSEFLHQDFQPINANIRQKYGLPHWVSVILSEVQK